jgi:hypothetical protein
MSACRKKETFSPVILDESGANLDQTGKVAGVTWPPILQTEAANRVWLEWLSEPAATSFHLRILLATAPHRSEIQAAAVACLALALDARLKQRALRRNITTEVLHRPDRIELALHGPADDLDTALNLVARILAEKKPLRLLQSAKGRLAADLVDDPLRDQLAQDQAAALGLAREQIAFNRATLTSLDDRELEEAYAKLTEPANAWMIVHAPSKPEQHLVALRQATATWKSRTLFNRSSGDAYTRFRPALVAPKKESVRLIDAPWNFVDTLHDERVTLIATTLVPLADAKSAAALTLLQRLLQEQLDVRLTRSSDRALLTWRLDLPNQSESASEAFKEAMSTFAQLTHSEVDPAHIRQSATLWLGARMVAASLSDDDWTQLWSESFDLVIAPQTLLSSKARPTSEQLARMQAHALALETSVIESTTSAQLKAVAQTFVDPWQAKAAWTWTFVGGSPKVRSALNKVRSAMREKPPEAP